MIHVLETQNHKSDLQDHRRSRWTRRSLMGAMSWSQRLQMKSSSHRPEGKCSERASMAQWLCHHQVEMEMILAEIVENVFQSEMMGRILRQLMMMRMKKNIRGAHVQL
jgi:hypothetical protein